MSARETDLAVFAAYWPQHIARYMVRECLTVEHITLYHNRVVDAPVIEGTAERRGALFTGWEGTP
jgi:hypothetical protein